MKKTVIRVVYTVGVLLTLSVAFTLLYRGLNRDQGTDIIYKNGTGYDLYWNDEFGVCEVDAIPNAECAINVATAILDGMHEGEIRHFPFEVFHDEDAGVWVVCFANEAGNVIGDEYSITLRQKDGQVLRIQFYE